MSYKIIGFEGSNIIFEITKANKEIITMKLDSLDYPTYCPPISEPKYDKTHYTLIENNTSQKGKGYNMGDIVLVTTNEFSDITRQTRPFLRVEAPNQFTEEFDGNTIKYRKTSQIELDRYEYLYNNYDGRSDNAKIYLKFMTIIDEQ